MTRWICLVVILAGLSGCGTLSAVSDATESLDAFTLSPAQQTAAVGGRLHIVVPPPTAGGAIATDRILVKPNRLQAAYLPGGRWVDPAPILIQSLVVASLQNSGGFRLVGRDDAGLSPDLTLLLDLTQFQAEAPAIEGAPWTVRVALSATLVDEQDRSIAATRRFEATSDAPGDGTIVIVSAFETATRQVLGELTGWVVRSKR